MTPSPRQSHSDHTALFRQVFDQRFQFTAVLDTAGIVVEVNKAPVRRGLAREDFLGTHIGLTPSFSSDPAWVQTWDARLAEAAEARYAISYEDVFRGPQGETRSADAVLTPVYAGRAGPLDSLEYFILEAEDTTERIQVEIALRASERRFHDFAESLPVMAWSTDAAGECDFLNRPWLDYTGAAPGQHHGWNWIDAVHPEDRPLLGTAWMAALRDGTPMAAEYRIRRYDDTARWFDIRVTPVRGDEGQVTRWYGTAADIHEAHELRRELEEREAQLRSALEAGAMARFAYDLEQRRFTSDPFLSELIDLPPAFLAEAGVEGFIEHVHPDDRTAFQHSLRRAFDPATPTFSNEYRLAGPADRYGWIGSRGRVEFDEHGKPRSIVGVVFALPGAGQPEADPQRTSVDPRD